MKDKILALAVLGAMSGLARADGGSIDIYAVVDDSVAHIDHSLPTSDVHTFGFNSYNIPGANQDSRTAIVSGAASMSRYGIKGSDTFSSGLTGFFVLEGAMNTATGQIANNGQSVLNNANQLSTISSASAINGQAFSRAAYVGVSAPLYGSIEIGRTVAFSTDQTAEFDPLHASGLYSPLGYSGAIGGGLGITENARLDNSVKYENKIGRFSFGAQYKLNQTDSSEAADVGSDLEGMVGFAAGPFSAELVGSKSKNTPALGFKLFEPDVSLRVSDSNGFMLSAKYQINPKANLSAGVEHSDQTPPSSLNNWGKQITTYYGMAIGGLVTAKPYNGAWGQAPITAIWAGGGYQVTEAFSLEAAYYDVDNGGNSHNDQYTVRQISLMPDYHFSQRFDVYAGLMFTHYSGSYVNQFAPIALATGNVLYGIGLRAKLSKEIL